MDTARIIRQASSEIEYGLSAIRSKRTMFRERLRLYINNQRDSERVNDNTIYALVQLYLAIEYSDEAQVIFEGRTLGADERADRLTALARYDYREMGLSEINFQKEWDRIFFGVGIRVKTWWDARRNTPVWIVKDPLSWIPDPLGNHIDPFRFHYFEEQMMREQMTEERGFDPEVVRSLTVDSSTTPPHPTVPSGMDFVPDDTPDRLYPVYNGYTCVDGIHYSITLDSSRQKLLRCVSMEPDTDGEIEDLVNLSYFSPLRGDPYGVSLVDLVEDKQRANSILLNLRLIDAKFATFGQMNLFDSRVLNKNDLSSPTIATKWIAFDSSMGVPISQAIYPVPRARITQDAMQVSDDIRRRIQLDTGIDDRTLGVESGSSLTLGEVQQIQANANLRLALNIEISNWGEKAFWKEWYRSYVRYFAPHDTKVIRTTGATGRRTLHLRREDIICDDEPDIIIESRRQIDAERTREKGSYMQKLSLLLADPDTPRISRSYALRKAYTLDGLARDEIMTLVPPTYEELDAEHIVALVNANRLPENLATSLVGRDITTYLVILGRADDTPARSVVMETIRRIMAGKENPT